MKLVIDSSKRFLKKVSLIDKNQKVVSSVESDQNILILIDEALRQVKVSLNDLALAEAEMEGESRVGILIGVSAANALNYSLGLKKVDELKYPEDPKNGIL